MIGWRLLLAAGGLLGAGGVALSALAAHEGGGNVAIGASFMLAHAPLFAALGLAGRGRVMAAAAIVILVGLALFCGDLLMRHFAGARLFPMAAPAGGIAMIAGWLLLAVSALPDDRR